MKKLLLLAIPLVFLGSCVGTKSGDVEASEASMAVEPSTTATPYEPIHGYPESN